MKQTSAVPSLLPPGFQVLSGSALKMIAMITMLIDHTGAYILSRIPGATQALYTDGPSIYRIFRDVGRIAFPIFVFLLIEGVMHTGSRLRYGRNLLLFALLSELPWNLVHTGTVYYAKQNVYFTLFIGYLAICLIEDFQKQPLLQLGCVLGLLWVSFYLNADYGYKGYVFILLMYWLRKDKLAEAVGGSCWLFFEWKACFAFIPINMYNGRRGFIHGFGKYFFYLFYPMHIFILFLIRVYILKLPY